MVYAEMLKNNVGGRKSRVTTQIHFKRRSEPAQIKERIALNHEGSLRKIVLRGNGLKDGIGQPVCQQAHSRRVASEKFARKGINLVIWDAHM